MIIYDILAWLFKYVSLMMQASSNIFPLALRPGQGGMAQAQHPDRDGYGSEEEDEMPTFPDDESSADGIERATPSLLLEGSSGGQLVSRSHREQGVLQARNTWLDDLTNKMLPPEETDLMVSRLAKHADEQFKRTYVRGVPTVEVQESAVNLMVGLSFLPGADKPQVNRFEQTDMAGNAPDQKDAMWRVNTAGSLLTNHDVAQDLSIIQTEQTSKVVRKVIDRRRNEDWLSRKKVKMIGEIAPDAVTIDSKRVKLVSDLRTSQWDLEAMLVEVDDKIGVGADDRRRSQAVYAIPDPLPHVDPDSNHQL
ncbi:uncharacterized protein KY384_007929 [Bacidia gigantensis]|uniref:uncharacterized protein n=1 Tax=Bacidia gigantensis TaxID=2732470 RepID=UPI001D04AA6E|nr:uncharacterized protein KY384_007929 [Bacidia gigantensis]KAG8527775.1 hypothetical protein KY384_007929 [Bacidia gigantensis]